MTKEEAIRRIKSWNLDSDDMEVLSVVIPELAESEDEKIRKELLEEIEFIIPHEDETNSEGEILPSYHTRIDRYKSYLEKQKEQKPAEWSEKDKDYYDAIIAKLEVTQDDAMLTDNQMDFLKSLRPPQYCKNCKLKRSVENWKPSKEQMEHLKRCFLHGKPHLPMPNQYVLESLYNDLQKIL